MVSGGFRWLQVASSGFRTHTSSTIFFLKFGRNTVGAGEHVPDSTLVELPYCSEAAT